jgi:ATP/ADP translocase
MMDADNLFINDREGNLFAFNLEFVTTLCVSGKEPKQVGLFLVSSLFPSLFLSFFFFLFSWPRGLAAYTEEGTRNIHNF